MTDGEILAVEEVQRRTRAADRIALGGSWLLALSAGTAAGLAQYASFAVRESDPYDRVALIIVGVGGALALASWLWWCIVRVRLRLAGGAVGMLPERGFHPFLALFFWLAVGIGGMIVAAVGGEADSEALPVILLFGAGCAGAIGGLLGVCRSFGRWFALELREERRVRAEVEAVVVAQGRAMPPARRGQMALGLVGAIVAGGALLGAGDIGGWLVAALPIPLPAAYALVLLAGIALCYPSVLAIVVAQLGNTSPAPPEQVRAYAYRAAAVATAVLAVLGVFSTLGLGLLALPVIIGLAVLAGALRRRYLGA